MKRPQLVIVHWDDITSHQGWFPRTGTEDQDAPLLDCQSAGYLVKKTKTKVILADTYAIGVEPEERWGSLTVIPLGCVKKIIVVNKQPDA